ncbi:MAG: MFS transporter [Phycisphaerae bacterium]|nr:MFS transporter [Phycisphaerae bacterium]
MTKPITVRPGPTLQAGEMPVVSPVPAAPDRPSRLPAELVRASLRNSIKDAVAWSVMYGAGTSYVTPYIVLGGKDLLYIAAFAGLPALAGALLQWLSANVTDMVGHRNRIIVPTAFLQALTWLPMCMAIFLPFDAVGYWVVLAAFVVNIALANFAGPPWQSIMGDLVPPERRGRYFGIRTALSGAVQVGAFFGAGAWLTWCTERGGWAPWGLSGRNFGFLVLFAIAGVARFVSAWYLSRVHEPEYRQVATDRFSLLDFIRRAPRAHFGRFVFYCMIINAGLGAVVPFLGWYLLGQLQFTPAAFAAVLAMSQLSGVLTQPLWGRLVDRLGSKRVLAIGGIGLVFVPLLLLVCRDFWAFMVVMAYEGVLNAAFSNAVGNYLYDVVTPPKRARCAAYYSMFVALGTLVGSFGAALLGTYAPVPLDVGGFGIVQPFTWLLLCSALLRLAANVLLLGTFEEFRLRRPAFET